MQLWPNRIVGGARVAFLAFLLLSWISCGDDSPTDPPASTKGSIEVTANVAGAAIFLDGADTGEVTDATLDNLAPGTYTVTVVLGNYTVAPGSIDVTVVAGETKSASFTLSGGYIAITSDVGGALIHIDGSAIDLITDDTTGVLSPGTHTVRLELAGYTVTPESLVVTVVKDSTSDAAFTLAAAPARSRKVIVEHFSNTSCLPCKEPDLVLEEVVTTLGHEVLASFGVHLWWPGADDPFWNVNSVQNRERATNQWDVQDLPEFHIDGEPYDTPGDKTAFTAAIAAVGAIDPAYDILVSHEIRGDSIVVSGSFYKRSATGGNDLFYAVIIETGISYEAENELDHFNDIARRFLPGIDGESIDLEVGEAEAFRYSWPVSPVWVAANLEVLAFIESAASREIYQGASTQ